ncbi:cytochrome P450 [Actinophytocola sp.]|jgi:cytochrome P450|uniref:cytochrome P450 n=1 Tax=Actinophytocola sp. TaxID=1872138 RepID=UPI002D343B1F|nr:cytochrome P450 [Actinophytocola sp.]HYQ63454.1 cytochrome P450 [Actinophytocola sp.]
MTQQYAPATRLFGPEFTAHPERTYEELRVTFGDAAPVELSPGVRATLVLSYRAALRVLRDPVSFRRDPRPWQYSAPRDSPVLGTMIYRPNAMFADGHDHRRLRGAITEALGQINHGALRRDVVAVADRLIDRVAPEGRADLMAGYALPLLMIVFTRMFGCTDELAERIMLGVQALFDGDDPVEADRRLNETMRDLLDHKRAAPGNDVVSALMASGANLSEDELKQTVLVLMGAGSEPAANLVGGALVELLTNPDLSEGLAGGTVAVDAAIDEILWRRPPMSNYCISYPVRPYPLYGQVLPPGEPVVVSLAAANADPAVAGDRAGNRAHLAFSTGAHGCPVPQMALLLASTAIERVVERLPGLTLGCPVDQLPWRVSPFSRGIRALPVTFPPAPVLTGRAITGAPATTPARHSEPRASSAVRVRSGVLAALARWWHGR